MTTIFGKIIKGELPCSKVFENERILAFKDIHPVAPVHILIVPKKEIPNLQSISPEDLPLVSEMVHVAQILAKEFGVEEGGAMRLFREFIRPHVKGLEHVLFKFIEKSG
jgi:histidine triad (HIT) family protein